MKKTLAILLALMLSISLLVGCGGDGSGGGSSNAKTATSTYTPEDGKYSISLTYPESADYRWSTDTADFRISSIHKAAVIGPDFKIGIGPITYPMGVKNVEELKTRRAENYEVADVTYGSLKGFSYYDSGYTSYVIILPIEGNQIHYIQLMVSDPNNSEARIHDLFKSDAVQNILKTVQIKAN